MSLPPTLTVHEEDNPGKSSPDEEEDLKEKLRKAKAAFQGLQVQNVEVAGRLTIARNDLADRTGELIAVTAEKNAGLEREVIWRQTSEDMGAENLRLRTQLAAAMRLSTPNLVQAAIGPIAPPVLMPDFPPPAHDDAKEDA